MSEGYLEKEVAEKVGLKIKSYLEEAFSNEWKVETVIELWDVHYILEEPSIKFTWQTSYYPTPNPNAKCPTSPMGYALIEASSIYFKYQRCLNDCTCSEIGKPELSCKFHHFFAQDHDELCNCQKRDK